MRGIHPCLFPIPHAPWEDVWILYGFCCILKMDDYFFMVVYDFLKMAHFIPCKKTHDSFIKEFVKPHGISKYITSNKDSKLVIRLWMVLCKMFGTTFFFLVVLITQRRMDEPELLIEALKISCEPW